MRSEFVLALSPSAATAVTHCVDGRDRLWELTTSKPYRECQPTRKESTYKEGRFSPDSRLLLKLGGDFRDAGIITLQDLATGNEVRHLRAPMAIYDAEFSPDGLLIAAACIDGNVYLWETATSTLLGRLAGHRREVQAVTFSPDGQQLASSGDDSCILIWDMRPSAPGRSGSNRPNCPVRQAGLATAS